MIHPQSLDTNTIDLIYQLVVATYNERDELYAAAEYLKDEDLSVICRKLAQEMAGNNSYLIQIILMHHEDENIEETLKESNSPEEMMAICNRKGDHGIICAVQKGQNALRRKYDKAIAATSENEMHEILVEQKKDIDFAERVLRKISSEKENSHHSQRRTRNVANKKSQ